MRLGRWHLSFEGALLLCLAGCVTFGVTRCTARRDAAREAKLAAVEATAYRLAVAHRKAVDSTRAIERRHAETDSALRRMEAVFTARDRMFTDSLMAYRAMLTDTLNRADSTDDAKHVRLRDIAERAIADGETYRIAVLIYRDSVASYRNATEAVLAAFRLERAAADSALAAKDAVIQGLTNAARCRIVGAIPCPSRTQSFFAGGGAVLLLLLL